jgi:nucleotide-binding universal stress UspA family protein
VRQVEPDLLVLGTRGRYGLARLLRDSIAEDALAYFDMDMLIARTGECEPLIDW